MKPKQNNKKSPAASDPLADQLRDSTGRSAKSAELALNADAFPAFASLAEAEACTAKTGDAYYEICYHLEGSLNLSLQAIHDLYAKAPHAQRAKMQTGIVRQFICPEGWPKHPQTLIYTLLSCARFRHEDTCHAGTVKEAMAALILEKTCEGSLHGSVFDRRTFGPWSPADAENSRPDLLRLCDWIESRFHVGIHSAWYLAPDCFSEDPEKPTWQTSALPSATLPNIPNATASGGKASTRGQP